jgi:ATP-binding cassette, subfamily F, member 3
MASNPAMSAAFATPGAAAALGRRGPSLPAHTPRRPPCGTSQPSVVAMAKVKKGGKKVSQSPGGRKALPDANANAVDIFGGADLDPDALLREALGVDDAANAKSAAEAEAREAEREKECKRAEKKEKLAARNAKKAGKLVGEADANAVDVFGEGKDGVSQEDLLAAAMAMPEPADKKVKKGKNKKQLVPQSDSTAVDIFGGAAGKMSPEELLAEAMAGPKPTEKQMKKAAKKGTKKAAVADDPSNVDKFGEPVAEVKPSVAEKSESEEIEEEAPAEVVVDDDDEDFEPDAEVLSEFDTFSEDVIDFTLAGRRKISRSKRADRNAEEGRLGDARRANFGTGGERFTSIRLEDVSMVFRNTTVLSGVTWGVKTGDRIGLVGANGAGKTTQLKLIAGTLEPTSGEVVRSSTRTKASFLRQEFVDELVATNTLREEFLTAFIEEQAALSAYAQTERDIEAADDDLTRLDTLLNQLESLRERCDSLDAWNLDSRIDKVMPGLGFVESDNDKLVSAFSGGWKVRIGIGKVLLQDPDLLLLDEPSNHLDMVSVEWLEDYLSTCSLPMVIVSHDREFLDRVANKMVHIDGGEAFEYPGNYSRFVNLRAERRKAWEAAYDRQSKFVLEQTRYIKQNRTSAARAKQVKSREKMLERMERTGQMVRQPPKAGKPFVFRFPPAVRSGRDVILANDVTHGYNGKILFKDASIAIERGDRMAIIGPNGCGKSTLLKLITGQEKPMSGTVECQELHNVELSYFAQNSADAMDLSKTVMETIQEAAPEGMSFQKQRQLLGKFLFKGDAVDKVVDQLSGGEKARLSLARMLCTGDDDEDGGGSNVLVFDEPTNHLDVPAQEMLAEALQAFQGSLLVVSHDRYFISQVANTILYIEDQELKLHDGDYRSYMEKNKSIKEAVENRYLDVEGAASIKSAPRINIEDTFDVGGKSKKKGKSKSFGGRGGPSGRDREMNAKRWAK